MTARDVFTAATPDLLLVEPVLRVQNLGVTFDTHRGPVAVLDDVSFEIRPGEILGVVGESGAGKSMAGNAVIGLISPPGRMSSGQVILHGERIDTLHGEDQRRLRGKHIGMVFQDPQTSLNPVLTIGQHLTETIRHHLPLSERQARQRAIDLLAEVDISDPASRFDQFPHQFSGGMRQRVAIALALCAEPSLLIADEPTTALDVSVQAQVIRVLRRICKEHGTAAMLITHDMGVIAEAADRVMVMYQGRVLETGPMHRVLHEPEAPYTRALMAAIPSLRTPMARLPVPGESASAQGPSASHARRVSEATKSPSGEAPLVEISGLSRDFDMSGGWLSRVAARRPKRVLHAVQDVSFSIARGCSFGLVGESGSGKSTVARMIAGLTRPTSGSVVIDNKDRWADAASAAASRRRFQMIFQDPYASLNPRWRVRELLAEPLEVLDLTSGTEETEARIQEALQRVRLSPDDMQRYPHQFSGGQRQRIAIARALVSRPEFIVCDEPTSSLDVSVQAQVLNLMKDLQDEFGLTYLLISHNLAVVRHMCETVGVMQHGRLVEVGSAERILTAPEHDYTRTLISAVPDMDRLQIPTLRGSIG